MMSFTVNDGARIFWRESGNGPPLLLIMGLGYSSAMWCHVEAGLARHFRVILFDNRGIGKSTAPPGPIRIADLAADATAVLDAAEVDSAFVFGLSMGGFIAQELALGNPRRVRALVLGATNCGGSHFIQAKQEVRDLLVKRADMPAEQSIRAMFPYIYDASTPAGRLEADLALRLANFPQAGVYLRQLEAISQWQSCDRLSKLATPTLILHGENDLLVPSGNAELLQQHIPGSRMNLIPEASHVFTTDKPAFTVQALGEFFLGQA
ncbi:MAG TPA: alpha/beta fold hydrolase [Xanthomonadales bacterium]|nr:alpha/beta fold hydrolase [Xanthomonadales bacterium]